MSNSVRVQANVGVPAWVGEQIADVQAVAALAASDLSAHEAASDPHANYIKTAAAGISRVASRRLQGLLEWCLPTHYAVMDPARHAGMTPIVNGALTMSQISTAEYPGSAIQLDITGAGTTSAHLLFPSADETALQSYTVKAGGEVHLRVKVSDWTKLTSLEVQFCQNGSTTNYRGVLLVSGNKTQFGGTDPAYSSAWNGVWRTVVFDSAEFYAGGSPTAWGDAARHFDVTGLRFICVATAAVNIQVARVYAAEWPVGVVVPIFDAWYKSAQQYVLRDFVPRAWGAGGSVLRIATISNAPTASDIVALTQAGFDVFPHAHGVSGGVATGLSGSATAVQVRKWMTEHRRVLQQSGCSARSLRWNQFFQNLGQYAGADMAGLLMNMGVGASRGDCGDARFGVNPANSSYMSLGSVQRETFARRRGQFNTRPIAAYTNQPTGAAYDGAPSNPAFPTLMSRVAYSASAKMPTVCYFHEILASPTSVDTTPEFWDAFVADLDTKVAAQDLIVLSPTELEFLTYWRPGELFMRWDGEWAYRHDPTKIAF